MTEHLEGSKQEWPWVGNKQVELTERRDALRRLCSRDSTNYSARSRQEHRVDLSRAETALASFKAGS
jgi:hypothetical protein